LTLDEELFRFFTDTLGVSYEPVEGVESHYSNCSNKHPIEIKPKEQRFDQAAEIMIDITETTTPGTASSGFGWSFGNIFKNKKDQIIYYFNIYQHLHCLTTIIWSYIYFSCSIYSVLY
jgi:hypothetical protein